MPDYDAILADLELLDTHKREQQWRFFKPYARQAEFLALGAAKRERLFMAGNKVGKTITGAFEAACHATGLYPSWWVGKRFNEPTTGWIAGESSELVRDIQQAMLFGTPGVEADWGMGMVPKKHLIGYSLGHGVGNYYDTVMVKHVTGGTSTIGAKTYIQPRNRWQAAYLHWLWCDEEPPDDLYQEGLARLRGNGIAYTTFTPFSGYSDVVRRFLSDASPEAQRDRGVVRMGLRHAEHFTEEEKQQRLAGYKEHERAARENGDPMLGEGAVFSTPIENLLVPQMQLDHIPDSWPRLWGVDFGIAHPFAAVLMAWDRDSDVIYLLREIRMQGASVLHHVDAMKQIAANVPVAWPHDGNQRQQGSGDLVPLAELYRKHGAKMLREHATFESGGYSFEAGVQEMEDRMLTNRLKLNRMMVLWQEEYSTYHRERGLVVKINDDLLSATRIAVMMRRKARCIPFGSRVQRPVPGANKLPIRNPWTGRVEVPAPNQRGAR
ncbi:MAG: terminase large subunit domain-containing protein [Pseudonocardiaceae bacterium]